MKKITARAIVCICLAGILSLGTLLFVGKFMLNGGNWVSFAGNRHLYTDGVLKSGRILDRNGNLLVGVEDGKWVYNKNANIRKATLHAVGVPQGLIGTGALTRFADKLTGYNLVTGAKPILPGGRDLYLTLDADVCQAAYKALAGYKGTVGVYNYKTGQILCMVSSPSYDPQNPPKIEEGDSKYEGVYMNRLLSATFIPGSTFKLVTVAAALDEIPNVQQQTFHCSGSYEINGKMITCPSAHGDLTLEQALNVSCNCTFGQLSVQLGGDILEQYAQKVGLTTNYSVNGIRTAVSTFDFNTGDDWELAWSGIGQGKDLVNPCAMMVYAGAIANGGSAANPQIISHTSFLKGVRTSIYIEHHTRNMLDTQTADTLAEMMRSNVINNYGQSNFPNLDIGAKSGTAQSDGSKEDNAWFVGFLQEAEHPLAFVVLVEGGGSGSKAAGKVANTVLQAAVKE
ncbi:penicillin-binding transpeptidase domain-containing protein [Clostridium aminobutyricum]|uniref:Penicillin-binding protein n=1 Tax=Clostridium aminobutyricum TaxID=33953 RepID=A0A939DAQ1_CLOAM|nr:penicillin-binding transpeptidase domain-containing protein [Clostridium aminobutyricum]MBN7774361.1 penicillin-binding protein [Clostridium aminobutyricum]